MKATAKTLEQVRGMLNLEASKLAEPYGSRIAKLAEFLDQESQNDNLPPDPDRMALELVKRFALSQEEPSTAVRELAESLALSRMPDIQQRYGRNRNIADPASLLTTYLQTEIILSEK